MEMIFLDIIKTIDLWTEQLDNHLECFNGAFVDGFENGNIPFDSYKVIKNCNCIITSNQDNINIRNKHNAIIFYKNNKPVRLMVINQNTDVDECIATALNQTLDNSTLNELYTSFNITRTDIDLKQQPIDNDSTSEKEIDVGSCDRPNLLASMLEGSYTQSDTDYGKSNSDSDYQFVSDIFIQYQLMTDNECFDIEHHCAFINETMTRIIPLQDNSLLNIESIKQKYQQNNSLTKKK